LHEFRHVLLRKHAQQSHTHPTPSISPPGSQHSLPDSFRSEPDLGSPVGHGVSDTVPRSDNQNEGKLPNYALTVDVLGFQMRTKDLKPDDRVALDGFKPTISRFLVEGIQKFVNDPPETDIAAGPSVRLTSGLADAAQLPRFWELMWVHVPINNTIWVHVCFIPRILLEMLMYKGLLEKDHGPTKS